MSKPIINWNKHVGGWYRYVDFGDFLNSHYMYRVLSHLSTEYKRVGVYPPKEDIFKSLRLCDPDILKVVILGSNPYCNIRSTGLAYGNPEGTYNISKAVSNIQRAVELDVNKGLKLDFDITLEDWAKQGVLLLNTSLTSIHHKTDSHSKMWEKFVKFVVEFIVIHFPGTIFMLWSDEAKKFEQLDESWQIGDSCHVLKTDESPSDIVLTGKHWECEHFSKANKLITDMNGKEYKIDW